jgi:TRAP-type C4-dicarboxylate transport system permease small subunit
MRYKQIVTTALMAAVFLAPQIAFAQSTDVDKVQSFVQSVITILVTFAGLLSVAFFVWGGVGYITSSGNPEILDRSKRTIIYSALGLVICLGAFVISNIVTSLAKGSFGS